MNVGTFRRFLAGALPELVSQERPGGDLHDLELELAVGLDRAFVIDDQPLVELRRESRLDGGAQELQPRHDDPAGE